MAASKTKLLRNLTPVTLRLRFGSKKEPYHVELQPRGQRGEVQPIPASYADHPAFFSNQGVTFEVITATVAKKLAESYEVGESIKRHPIYDNVRVSVERDADSEVTVATFNLSEKGRITEVERSNNGMRIDRGNDMEPPRAAVAGSEDGPDPASARQPRKNKADVDLPTFKGITERTKS